MTCYSDTQMAAALRLFGVSAGDAAVLVATSHPESGGCNVIQQGQPYATTGWGIWQITPGNSEPSVGTNNSLLSLLPNAHAASLKLRSQGLGAWTTVTSGAYRPYLPAAQSAVSQVYHLPLSQVQTLAKSAPGSSGSGGSGISTTGFNPFTTITGDIFGSLFNDIAKSFGAGSVKDMWIRAALIVLGGLLILVGIAIIGLNAVKGTASSDVGQLAIETVAPEAGGVTASIAGSSGGQSRAIQRSRARTQASRAQSERIRAESSQSRATTQAARERRLSQS